MAHYYYFTDTGKWKYEGLGADIPEGYIHPLTHNFLAGINGGKMPGIAGTGKDYTIVVISKDTYPRLVWGPRKSGV